VPRPPSLWKIFFGFFYMPGIPNTLKTMAIHASGRMLDSEKTYVPESDFQTVYWKARVYLAIYASVIGASIYTGSILPLMFIGLPNMYGVWLANIYGMTQHAALAENVLDHRLNCRTMYLNPLNRWLYWNMNYHVEHHMFPMVPFHRLAELHEAMKHDTPKPYNGLAEAYKEIIPSLLRQIREPGWFVQRELPAPSAPIVDDSIVRVDPTNAKDGWVPIGFANRLNKEDAMRVDCGSKTFAVYRSSEGKLHATEGVCTHGNAHLADGMVFGNQIECPKHNGRFDIRDGSVQRAPVCVGLCTYEVEEREGAIWLETTKASGAGADLAKSRKTFRVVSNENVATFIKELVIEPTAPLTWTPGDYLQFEIPQHDTSYDAFQIADRFAPAWDGLRQVKASNKEAIRRNYSIASNPLTDSQLRFNVRIAVPPAGQDVPGGAGSSWVFSLKAGDTVSAIGPFGDFHLKDSEREAVYIGGGAGMAPLRAHIAHLFESKRTTRKVSFWYGARSLNEIFYRDYFEQLSQNNSNFRFELALSEPQADDDWNGAKGFIHQVALDTYLNKHEDIKNVEFYLCGPPAMMQATRNMLSALGVSEAQIAYDEF
jgi:Na+-transporting NADH:ubiquinone oxidoreductase subunit F